MRRFATPVDSTFAAWLYDLDALLMRRYGVTTDALPEFDYTAEFEAGVPADAAAEHTLNAHVPF